LKEMSYGDLLARRSIQYHEDERHIQECAWPDHRVYEEKEADQKAEGLYLPHAGNDEREEGQLSPFVPWLSE